MTQAEQLYPQARIYYERIEPVAEVWGTLDTAIDGRIDNPVTNPADLRASTASKRSCGPTTPSPAPRRTAPSW